jgi:peptide chain release factor 2
MAVLNSKLFEYLQEKQAEKLDEIRGEHKKIEWGNQIRSYVFHPYQMVKDHRTDFETSKTDQVMDGALTPFIEAYLKHSQE